MLQFSSMRGWEQFATTKTGDITLGMLHLNMPLQPPSPHKGPPPSSLSSLHVK